jgi:META domain
MPWVLTAGVDVQGWEDAAPSASFEDGRLSGSTGCNRYSGPYTVDGDTLELVARWRLEDDEFVLGDADAEKLLRFCVVSFAPS